jgi:hypothetical protein
VRRAALILALLALVTGCGDDEETTTLTTTVAGATGTTGAEPPPSGGDGGQGAGNKDQAPTPEAAISRSAATVIGGDDPGRVCGELVTERYVRDAYGSEQGCRDAQLAEGRFEVRIRRIEVNGDTATAVATPAGGPNEGIEIDLELVLQDGVWKLDRARADVPAGP